jgi:OOP family OmpA-OmpF porin
VPPEVHPYEFAIVKGDSGWKLTGSTPNAAARRMIEALAEHLAAGQPVSDKTEIASGLPESVDFAVVAQFALAELSKLASGEAKLADTNFSLHGVARDEAGADEANAALGDLLAGVHIVDAKIEPPAPPAAPPAPAAKVDWDNVAADVASASVGPALEAPDCQSEFKNSLDGAAIKFDTDQATVSTESYALIVKLAAIALRCKVPQIEISGHTDNTGDDSINQPLSQARAEAVANLLVRAGVPVSRLSAVGYGATRPIAPNDTEDGRAKNRRIEFEVKS